uniref:TIGR00725 family protein n=1 Tax=Caldimicrobium thiodismutans TaxID=1653476 RepID=A0A832GLP5_9BACT
MALKNRRIAIIGAGIAEPPLYDLAFQAGYTLGKEGAIILTGGLGGVMEAALKGAREAGALTVGILPGNRAEEANPYVLIPIVTDMGHARNVILVRTAELIISIGGGYGTLSEIALALKMWKPVIGLQTWPNIPGVHYISALEELLPKVCEFLC